MIVSGYRLLMVKTILGIAIFFVSCGNLFSQDTAKLNHYLERIEAMVSKSLKEKKHGLDKQELWNKKLNGSETERINASLELFNFFVYKSTDSAKKHNDDAERLSRKIDFPKGYLKAQANQGYIFFINGDFENTIKTISQIETDPNLVNNPQIKEDIEILKSYVYTERGEYPLALETAMGALEKGEKLKDSYILMRSYSAISHVYLRLGEYKKALDNCLQGLEYILELEKIQFIFPKIDEIARMIYQLEGSEKALKVYDFYLKMEQKVSSPGSFIQSVVYMNIAEICKGQDSLELANRYLQKSLALIEENNYRFRKPRVHVAIAELSLLRSDTTNAIKSYEKAFVAAQNIDAFDVIKKVSGELYELHGSLGNDEISRNYQMMYGRVSDSLFSTESDQKIMILEAQRQISEILRQKGIIAMQKAAKEQQNRFLAMISILMVLLAGLAGFSYYKVKKKNRLLFDRTKELAVEKVNKGGNSGVIGSYKKLSENKTDQIEQDYIDKDIKEIILTKLDRLEREQFFLDTKCNLSKLSDELQTNQKYLSLVINHEKKSNFNNYINDLRINYLLERLVEDSDFRSSKLSYIARASGFNNQNTFYTAFKKRLGILPSYFITKLNDEEKFD